MKAIVKEIQVGGYEDCPNLEEACKFFTEMMEVAGAKFVPRTKIIFVIQLPNGETKQITIRDEDYETVAYGDFEGLPSILDYAKELAQE